MKNLVEAYGLNSTTTLIVDNTIMLSRINNAWSRIPGHCIRYFLPISPVFGVIDLSFDIAIEMLNKLYANYW
jgi:hypothetical protein